MGVPAWGLDVLPPAVEKQRYMFVEALPENVVGVDSVAPSLPVAIILHMCTLGAALKSTAACLVQLFSPGLFPAASLVKVMHHMMCEELREPPPGAVGVDGVNVVPVKTAL